MPGRHGEHAARRRHIERVGGGELLLRDDVRDDRFLRRRPQHREDLENERGEDQSEQAVDERQREEDERPTDIAEQHHPLAIEAVDDHTCRSGEEESGSDTGREDQRNRGSLRPVADAFGERDDRNQAEPVTCRRDDLGDPELEELHDPKTESMRPPGRGTDRILQAIRTGTGGAHADDLRGPEQRLDHSSSLEAAAFLAAFFLVAFFFVAFLADFFFVAFFLAGPLARRSARSSAARSTVSSSTVSPLRNEALYSPSVTYGPKRPSLTIIGLPVSGSGPMSRSGSFGAAWPRRRFGWAGSPDTPRA